MNNKIKITFVVYRKLLKLVNSTLETYYDSDIEFSIIDTTFDNLMSNENVNKMKKADVLIAGDAFSNVIKQNIMTPVVQVSISTSDYIQKILEAKQVGTNIAIASYNPIEDFNCSEFSQIFNVNLINIVFQNMEDLEQQIKENNLDFIIGASLANEVATKFSIPATLVYSSSHSVITAIKGAKKLALSNYTHRQNNRLYEAVINFNPSGILVLDDQGYIISSNPSASKILNTAYETLVNKHIDIILKGFDFSFLKNTPSKQFKNVYVINENNIAINTLALEEDINIIGYLITLEKISYVAKVNPFKKITTETESFKSKHSFDDIIGESSCILEEISKAKKFSKKYSNILITGPTGTGKELFAQSIHNASFNSDGPFVAINCAALPKSMLESELFGYEEGAFAGSRKNGKQGLFEIANGGTIFLDEIGALPIALQARILRVIQEKEIIKLGGNRIIPINVRIICATNTNLKNNIPLSFREDLYYRLNVLQLKIPPLKDRDNDIKLLFAKYLNLTLTPEISKSLEVLKVYSWPGNIRELLNIVERVAVEIGDLHSFEEKEISKLIISAIGEEDFLQDIFKSENISNYLEIKNSEITPSLIEKLSVLFPKNQTRIAEILNLSRTTLWRVTQNFNNT